MGTLENGRFVLLVMIFWVIHFLPLRKLKNMDEIFIKIPKIIKELTKY